MGYYCINCVKTQRGVIGWFFQLNFNEGGVLNRYAFHHVTLISIIICIILFAFVIFHSTHLHKAKKTIKSNIVTDTTRIAYKLIPNISKGSLSIPRMLDEGYYILIQKSDHLLSLYKDGIVLKQYKVALGKNPGDKQKVGDCRTPEGHFYINYIKDASKWTHDFKDGKGEIKGAYGPWYFALYTGSDATFSKKKWTGIGIHGTHAPESIGTNASEGCIRLSNENLIELYNIIKNANKLPVDIVK